MKFTKDEIFTMYGLPRFMYNSADTVQMDIEQQTLNFKNFTILPITAIYIAELQDKLLKKADLLKDIAIRFDTDVLIDADITAKANAYRSMVTSGMASPNEAIIAMGNKPIENENGDLHYIQSQNLPIESYDLYVKDKFSSVVGDTQTTGEKEPTTENKGSTAKE
jgi:phage portal protein BeeE